MMTKAHKVNSYSWSRRADAGDRLRRGGADLQAVQAHHLLMENKGTCQLGLATVYVREGDKWKNVFYAETKAVDAKAPPAKAKTGEARAPGRKALTI